VLEHVPDLVAMMTTCLALLRPGGRFHVSVPYDLSLGAWQDPTHVRSFNERSWLYYTDWFWYLGWHEARFVVDVLDWVLSPVGMALRNAGTPNDVIARTPRAIDSMSVTLRKINLTPEDRVTMDYWREKRRVAETANKRPALAPAAAPAEDAPIAFAGGWEPNKDRYCVWIVTPEGYEHHHAFDDTAFALSEAFAALGGSAPIVHSPQDWAGRTPIVFGAHLLAAVPAIELPSDSVLFNLEQVDAKSFWMNAAYLTLLRRFAVLDYSVANTRALGKAGVAHAKHLPVGYMPGLTRIAPAADADIDVLFYGSLNERRVKILEALRERGLNVVHLFGVYGAARDAAIARAKVVLNLHFYDASIFEIVRVGYLLANAKCVVSEGTDDDPDSAPFRDGLCLCPYEAIVETCVALVADPERREALARRGFALMRGRPQTDLLRAAFT